MGSRTPAEPPPRDDLPPDSEAAGPPGDPETVARAICLRLLERRARSRSELTTALQKRGVPDDAAKAVLDRFTEVGLIDDTALALTMGGAVHRERGLAGRAVAVKLRQRGLGEADVRQALEQITPDGEREQARRLAATRLRSLGGLDPQVQTRRLAGLLARKGYSSELTYEVVREVMRQDESFDS